MVDVSLFDPVQDKFFSTHINSSLLGLFRKRINEDFQQAYSAFRDAELIFGEAFRALPSFGNGSTAATEKADAFARSVAIGARVREKGQSHKKAVQSCRDGAAELTALARSLGGILERAAKGAPGEGGHAIRLEKQLVLADLNTLNSRFEAAAQTSLDRIRKAMPEAWAAMPPVIEFQTEVAVFRNRIRDVTEKGTELAAARKALAAIRSEMEKLFDTQVARVATFAGSSEFTGHVEDATVEAGVRNALEDARAQAELLRSWQVPGSDGVVSAIGPLSDQATTLFSKATKEKAAQDKDPGPLKAARIKLQKDLEARAAEARKMIADRKAEFTKRLEAVQRKHKSLNAAFLQIDNATLLPEQAALIRRQLATADSAVNDLNGFNTAALDAAMILLEDCAVLVLAAQKAGVANREITTKLRTLGNAIQHGTGSDHPLADRLQQHLAEYTDLGTTWPTLPLPEAIARVRDFETRVKATLTLDTEIIQRRQSAREALAAARRVQKEVDTKYAAFIKARTGKKVKTYAGQPVTDLDQAASWIETKTALSFYVTIDDLISKAELALRDLSLNLDANGKLTVAEVDAKLEKFEKEKALLETRLAAAGPGAGLKSLEADRDRLGKDIAGLKGTRTLVEDAAAQEKAAAADKAARDKLKADSEAYDKAMRGRIKGAKPGNPFHDHKDEIEGHLERLATTRKAIKTIPLAQAQKELAFVRQMISDLAARGEKTTPRNLDNIGKEWAAAVGVFSTRVDALVRAVEEFAKAGGPADAAPKLRAALDKIARRLDAKAFDSVAADLKDPEKAKAARETALRRVRVLQDIVRKDPVMQRCVANPFAVKGFATDLDFRLRQIELNVLRGV